MGSAASRQLLPPAEEVSEGPYDLRALRAPRLTGRALQWVTWLLDSTPLAGPLWARSMRDSGIPQAIREQNLPEAPTFQPLWPLPPAGTPCAEGASVDGLGVGDRLEAAAQAIPDFGELRSRSAGGRVTVSDLRAAYASGAASPEAVAEAALAALAATEVHRPPLRLLIACDPADVRRQAAESTARYRAGAPLSGLDGVPYAVIDGIDALPYPTTAGTSYLGAKRPVRGDAPAVTALRRAGAVLLGKANLHEVGVGMTGLNLAHGTARNPHDPARFCGGSSSGCAAAVAAGICPFAIGIDGGGSVRVPAALCGVAALRPTVGRTSTAHCPPNAFSIMAFGTIAGCLADALLVYAAIGNAGTDAQAFRPAPVRVPARLPGMAGLGPGQPLAGQRVGVFWRWFEDADAEVVAACRHALRLMEEQGCEVVPVCMPELELTRVSQLLTIGAELRQAHLGALLSPALRRRLQPDTRVTLACAARFSATDLLQAQKARTRALTHVGRLFCEQHIDYVATPTVAVTAPPIRPDMAAAGELDLRQTGDLMRFTIAVNFCGLPALSVPVGHSAQGLPIGLQLMGQAWAEARLLSAGAVLEAAVRARVHTPRIFFDLLRP
ncbi:hypothetical protein WJX81_007196 [Elliptochloris bilobata]|uniref:Amidase domain-containing protein n=1 Tax=Elliptochloris bilobata TaxID=381761 RepID=A0AAW1S7T7_9CHLO